MQQAQVTDILRDVTVTVGEKIGAGKGTITAGDNPIKPATELAEQVRAHLVIVDPHAPSCCIDGRCAAHTLAGNTDMPEPRPAVAGGGNVTAYAAAELAGYFVANDTRHSSEKLQDIDSKLRSQGLVSGSHGDTAAAGNDFADPADLSLAKTGCGAADKFKVIIGAFYDSESLAGITTYAAAIMPSSTRYNETLFELPTQADVAQRIAAWDPRANIELTSKASGGHAVEILSGEHAEVLVVFNYVDGTTVDRDNLVRDTGKQVFVVDVWYIEKLAQGLAIGRPDEAAIRPKLLHYMLGYQIATYLILCDGTQRPAMLSNHTS